MTPEQQTLASLDRIPCAGNRFDADALPDDLVAALKQLERRNRNIGASGRATEDWAANRGSFRLHAEAAGYLHYLRLERSYRVLDAGAGLGRLALLVAPKVARLVCVDFAEKTLDVLRDGAARRGIRNIETQVADICELSAPEEPFDAVYSVETIEQIASHRERLKAMTALRNSLRPGGRCVVSVFPWNSRVIEGAQVKEGFYGAGARRLYRYRFTPEELRALFAEAGFRDIRIQGLIAVPNAVTRRLPPSFAFLETWCSRIPAMANHSWLLLGIGIR